MSEDKTAELVDGDQGETQRSCSAFFRLDQLPLGEMREGLKNEGKEGIELDIRQAEWLGFNGDAERLRDLHGAERRYGEAAWMEVEERLSVIFGDGSQEKVSEMLAEVRKVHDGLVAEEEKLSIERKTYYHNVSTWEEASGHADQITLHTARELVGALELGDLDPNIFDLEKMGIVLQAMVVHDTDWSVFSKKDELLVNGSVMFGINVGNLDEVVALVGMVDYDSDEESKRKRESGIEYLVRDKEWDEGTVQIVRNIVRRSDLMQVGDKNYPSTINRKALVTDFVLRRPDLVEKWEAEPETELEPRMPFYLFARSKVLSQGDQSFKYSDQFFGSREKNLAFKAWKEFERQVQEADPDGWKKYQERTELED